MYFAAGSAISAPSASWDPNPGGWRDEVGQVSETNKSNGLQGVTVGSCCWGRCVFWVSKRIIYTPVKLTIAMKI